MRKSVEVELPVIEDISDDPYSVIQDYLRKNKYITHQIAIKLLKTTQARFMLYKLEEDGVLRSEKKYVKFAGELKPKITRLYSLV